jgi:hypothetical protein
MRQQDDLGQEAVGAHELVQRVLEQGLILFGLGVESLDGGCERGVDLAVLLGLSDGDQGRDGRFDLFGPQHVVAVQAMACVP